MKNVILVGSGGHALSIMALKSKSLDRITAYTDIVPNKKFSLTYAGTDGDVLNKYDKEKYSILIGLSYVGTHVELGLRKKLINTYREYDFYTVVADSGIIKENVSIGNGSVVFENVLINISSKLGLNCVVNTAAIIEHHCILGDNVQIGPGCVVCGNVEIGSNTFIGAGSVIRDSVKIADNVIVGLGSIVTNDLIDSGLYFGSPAKRVR
ncbi:transferase [Spirochaetia bacterium]|nr:transferase [Spirochaetia bacterium]